MKSLQLLPLFVIAATACGESFSNNIPANADGGVADQPDNDAGTLPGSDRPVPPPCNTDATPLEAACLIDDSFGIFVSSSLGKDDGDGSRAKPLKSLQKALDAAATAKKRVYACGEPFLEAITVPSGTKLFGYLECENNWITNPARRATVRGPTSPVVTALNVSDVYLDAMNVEAPAGTATSRSSIGMIVSKASQFAITRGSIVAGAAANGADGVQAADATNDAAHIKGGDNVALEFCTQMLTVCRYTHFGGAGGENTCAGLGKVGKGGDGGYGGKFTRTSGGLTIDEPAEAGASATGSQGWPYPGGGAGQNKNALAGAKGAAGANGATGLQGVVTLTGFVPGDGSKGQDGQPGMGGGGGQGRTPTAAETSSNLGPWFGPPGSGGGAGGCPGLAGTPGLGGGASIALIVGGGSIKLTDVVVKAGNGGNGGKGTLGSVPASGGGAGLNVDAFGGPGMGAAGGRGGVPGTSGSGSGGPSIAVVYGPNSEPTAEGATQFVVGKAGKGVVAQSSAGPNLDGVLSTIAASPDGVAVPKLAVNK